jgi:hypothetical protein
VKEKYTLGVRRKSIHRLRVFENKTLRRIFGPKREVATVS